MRCQNCKVKFTPQRFLQKFCEQSEECMTASIKYAMDKVKASKLAKSKIETKELKENLKTLSEYEAEAKKSFQKWIRLRDIDLPCISCGNSNTNDWSGGHYFPAGIYSGLIFDERNCHKQCNTNCNKHMSGNLLEYRKGLVKRYGLEFVEKLEADSDLKRNYKYTKEQLIAKKIQYDIKIKEMKP